MLEVAVFDDDATGAVDGLTPAQRAHLEHLFQRSVRSPEELRTIVGRRFFQARELNGFGQTVAASLLGYENGTQLSLIERGQRLAPLRLILSAAAVYAVSADYLIGIVDDPEPDRRLAERHAFMRHVGAIVRSGIEGVTAMLSDRLAAAAPPADAWQRIDGPVRAVLDAFASVRNSNAELYETEFRGGARLDAAMQALRSALDQR